MCGVVKLNYLRNRGWWAAASARLWQRALSSPCSSLQTQKAGEIQENVYREKLGCVTYGHELGDWDSHLGACANASESCTHISASFEGESSPSFRRTRAAAAAAAAAARAAAFEREATWEEAMHELKVTADLVCLDVHQLVQPDVVPHLLRVLRAPSLKYGHRLLHNTKSTLNQRTKIQTITFLVRTIVVVSLLSHRMLTWTCLFAQVIECPQEFI